MPKGEIQKRVTLFQQASHFARVGQHPEKRVILNPEPVSLCRESWAVSPETKKRAPKLAMNPETCGKSKSSGVLNHNSSHSHSRTTNTKNRDNNNNLPPALQENRNNNFDDGHHVISVEMLTNFFP